MTDELERVRQEMVDLAGETRAADFERLVREDERAKQAKDQAGRPLTPFYENGCTCSATDWAGAMCPVHRGER